MRFLTQIEQTLSSIERKGPFNIPQIKEQLSEQTLLLLLQKATLSGEYIEEEDLKIISNIESQLTNLSMALNSVKLLTRIYHYVNIYAISLYLP